MALTKEQREDYFKEYGVYPIEYSDIPNEEFSRIVPTQQDEKIRLKYIAINYLNSTDWYTARKIETGKEIPQEVLEKRAQARIDANFDEAQ